MIFMDKYPSSRKPQAVPWMTRIVLFNASTHPSETLFTGLQQDTIPSQAGHQSESRQHEE